MLRRNGEQQILATECVRQRADQQLREGDADRKYADRQCSVMNCLPDQRNVRGLSCCCSPSGALDQSVHPSPKALCNEAKSFNNCASPEIRLSWA